MIDAMNGYEARHSRIEGNLSSSYSRYIELWKASACSFLENDKDGCQMRDIELNFPRLWLVASLPCVFP